MGTNQLQNIDAIAEQVTEQVTEQVQLDVQQLSRTCSAMTLAWSLFSQRCTLIAMMRYSLIISSSMSTLLFICDVATASALAALFFQATGGALAEDADPQCEP